MFGLHIPGVEQCHIIINLYQPFNLNVGPVTPDGMASDKVFQRHNVLLPYINIQCKLQDSVMKSL